MEASEAIDPMEGICLFLWSDALPTTRPLTRTRALLLRAVRTPIDRFGSKDRAAGDPHQNTPMSGPAMAGELRRPALTAATVSREANTPVHCFCPRELRVFDNVQRLQNETANAFLWSVLGR
jgi:hypothetical protein